jgi:tRNA threonylcarbamoyladenosine biosynthesis protein TsaB
MSLILSLDTSSTSCSVALHDSGKLLIVSEIHQEHAHGGKLSVMIRQVMENGGFSFEDLRAVALSSGPGSYTGLRIGTSTAKGICFSLNIPLIAMDSLSIMTWKVIPYFVDDLLFCPMLDARRMEVYSAVLDKQLNFVEPIQSKIIDEDSFRELLDTRKIVFFGNGAEKCKMVIHHNNAVFIDNVYPAAQSLGEMAFAKFETGKTEDLVHFEPLYLKEFLIKKSINLDPLMNK